MKDGKSICVLIAAGKFGNIEGYKIEVTRSELNSIPVRYPHLWLPIETWYIPSAFHVINFM